VSSFSSIKSSDLSMPCHGVCATEDSARADGPSITPEARSRIDGSGLIAS
jgi:hypothetical protein